MSLSQALIPRDPRTLLRKGEAKRIRVETAQAMQIEEMRRGVDSLWE
jgi:hypothetical protein